MRLYDRRRPSLEDAIFEADVCPPQSAASSYRSSCSLRYETAHAIDALAHPLIRSHVRPRPARHPSLRGRQRPGRPARHDVRACSSVRPATACRAPPVRRQQRILETENHLLRRPRGRTQSRNGAMREHDTFSSQCTCTVKHRIVARAPGRLPRHFASVLSDSYDRFEELLAARDGTGLSKQERVRRYVLEQSPETFAIADVRRALPGISNETIRLVLGEIKHAGQIESTGPGRGARWRRTASYAGSCQARRDARRDPSQSGRSPRPSPGQRDQDHEDRRGRTRGRVGS